MKIYQVYHENDLYPLLQYKPYYIHYYTKEDKGINHLEKYLNEFVCQYYVYKNKLHNDDDIVGFYHYRRYYVFTDGYEFNKIEDDINNKNVVYGLRWYNIKDVLTYNKKSFLFNTLYDYIKQYYPELLIKFQNLDWYYKSIQHECFISRYDDFCKYVEFILGYFKYVGIDFEKCSENDIKKEIDSNKFVIEYYNKKEHPWYLHEDNKYRKLSYIIELLCALYWSLIGKNIKTLWEKNDISFIYKN